MADLTVHTSEIMLNIKDLSSPIKERLAEWKKWPTYMLYIRTHFKYNHVSRLKMKDWRSICYANTNQKRGA